MPYANQTYQPTEVGRTEEAREAILEAFEEHMMSGLSAHFFPMHAPQTMKRLCRDYPEFSIRYNEIIRKANAEIERIALEKMRDSDKPYDMRAWELITRHRKGFKPEVEEDKDKEPIKIEIEMVKSRDEANNFRENNN